MDSTTQTLDNILKNFGGASINSLNEILQNIENDHEIDTIKNSPYYTLDNLPCDISENSSNFLALSLNAQSILAKFGTLDVMIQMFS